MRIVSGKYRGRNIPVRKNFPSRPTTDFAKENIFNVLSNYFHLEEMEVLDLFAGTGNISYEFASRGCAKVVSVEKDYQSISFIKSNIEKIGISTIEPIKMDVFKYLEYNKEKRFDLIFADPPYNLENLSDLPQIILGSNILKKDCWLILEHGKSHQFNDNKHFIEQRRYGSVHFSIFKAK